MPAYTPCTSDRENSGARAGKNRQTRSPASRGLLTRTPLDPDSDPPAQIGYVMTNNAGAKLAIHVLAFSNTVSWQFRYEPVPGTYLPLTAQRVMDSLADQMRAVQDLNR